MNSEADEFGFKAMEDFIKEDLARNEKEEKKIKALRKEKREREEKGGGKAGLRVPRCRGQGQVLRFVEECRWSKERGEGRQGLRRQVLQLPGYGAHGQGLRQTWLQVVVGGTGQEIGVVSERFYWILMRN